jgi:hypothetical protein
MAFLGSTIGAPQPTQRGLKAEFRVPHGQTMNMARGWLSNGWLRGNGRACLLHCNHAARMPLQ